MISPGMYRKKKRRNNKKVSYLYILERTQGRGWWAIFTNQCEVKIGITTSLKRRVKSIQKTTEGKVELTYHTNFNNAYRIEQKLHRIFSDSNFKMRRRGNRSNGETEWFYLNMLEMIVLRAWIWYYKNNIMIWTILILLSLVTYIVYLDFKQMKEYENRPLLRHKREIVS